MKKVGIVTYQDIADGKGRFLQAYALYVAITTLGYDAEIIDYYPITLEEKLNSSLCSKIQRLIKHPSCLLGYIWMLQYYIINKIFNKKLIEKRKKYESFILKNIKVTKEKYYGYQAILRANLCYDAFICGSDQIWNPYFQGENPAYYLQFAPKEKRIAYAPSLGTTQINDIQKEKIKQMISEIPFISVREESGAKLINDLIGRNVKNVVDPTLLLPREWWNNFAEEIVTKRPYVLTFLFDNSIYPRKVAKRIARKYGYDIISIPDTFVDIFFNANKEIGIGPERFVGLFKNASFICTQSFHGVILAMIYNIPFYAFNRETKVYVSGVFSRISDLLKMVGLEARILKNGSDIPNKELDIDYSNSNKVLDSRRRDSLNYLENSLSKVLNATSATFD